MLPTDALISESREVIYQIPHGKIARIKSIEVVNLSLDAQTFTLWLNNSGQPRPITPIGTFLDAGWKGEDTIERILPSGATIEGECSRGGTIAIIISGEEQ